ncbi:MAG: tetratricopeptide repeat protein, partial [Chrysiogenetes bacterium]|nr:tetratricopeptide repeat protein [Chrysiogenetes bacterium]
MAEEPEIEGLPEEVEERIDRGDYAGALSLLESLEVPAAGDLRAELFYRIGYCRLHLGRYGQAQEALLAARAADEGEHFRFRISVALANLMLRSGRYGDAAKLLRDLLESGGHDPEEETLLHYSLGQAEFYLGELKEAIASFHKALAHYRKSKSARGIISTLQSLAAAHQLRHEVEPATDAYLEAYELSKKQEDWQSVGLIYLNLGALYQDRGHYINAEHYFDQALAIMRDLGRVPYEVSLLCNLGNLTVRMGLLDEASEYFEGAEKLLEEKPELKQYRGYLHAYRSELHADTGDFDAAARDLKDAQEIFSALKNPKDLALVAEGRIELAVRAH